MRFLKSLTATVAALATTVALGGDTQPISEKKVLGLLEISNHAEIDMGELAIQKKVSEDVKEFAQHLIADHEAADAELHALAEDRGFDLDAIIEGDAELKTKKEKAEADLRELQGLEGDAFEKKFLKLNVAAHTELAQKLKLAQPFIEMDDLDAHVGKVLPKVEYHRDHAQSLLEKRL